MKNRPAINKNVWVVVFLFCLCSGTFAQESCVKNRTNTKLSYSRYKTGRMIDTDHEETTGHYRLEINYGVTKYLEGGVYFGVSKFGYMKAIDSSSTYSRIEYLAPFYGINVNFHVLPFLIASEDFRFDLYVLGKAGGASIITTTDARQMWEYSLGIGTVFYPWDHIGIFCEFNVGEFINENLFENDYLKLRYGISIKF